mmetsp:Transcript_7664/g.14039  ORF Transcript_7664/g.14039 Transcript_7664/m.14039 type:complete len:231 (+) Transcript_7664:156-848(+)
MLEEPPRIERIVSSRGINLADTATILQAYLSSIDDFHKPTPIDEGEGDETAAIGETGNNHDGNATPRKSRQEIEDENLLQQLTATTSNSGNSISDDVYERLKIISDSIVAELSGKPLSVVDAGRKGGGSAVEYDNMNEEGDTNVDGAEEFLQELKEAERNHAMNSPEEQPVQDGQQQQHQQHKQSKKDKKKDKKAKKAAKKAKKEMKRKAKEMNDTCDQTGNKRVKLEHN